jgi:NO-binding membrane sensor protein with MHYT domain/two-component sensor histidine kinase
MNGSYDSWLVLLSVIVAVFASFVALDLGARLSVAHRSAAGRWLWLVGGAWSMGTGIWSMHFIGMLAFRLPVELSYDLPITLASGVAALLASALALVTVSRNRLGTRRLLIAGALMGVGIVSMHYIGMHAMRMMPPIRYQPALAVLSVAIAIAASIAALWCAYQLRMETIVGALWKKAGSALLMGSGIYGMHYTAMVAARFAPDAVCMATPHGIDPTGLAAALGGFTLLMLMVTLLISSVDAYRAAIASRQVGDLSQRLMRLQDEERRRLAAELHDIVGQSLSAANAELALLRRGLAPEQSERVAAASALVRESAESVRQVMTELRPPGIDELGLAAALRWHAGRLAARTGIEVDVQADVGADESLSRPSPQVEDTLLRIYVEALGNVAKHAQARRVEVRVERRDGDVVLEVADDGRGFDPSRRPRRDGSTGWGIMIMEERARSVGARLRIRSAPGKGTRIELVVPREAW